MRDWRDWHLAPAEHGLLGALRRQPGGWTLIELMLALAIIAIVASMAYPSYTEYVHKGRRADAVAALGAVQQAQERYRSNYPTYGTLADIGAADISAHGHYKVSISGTPTPSAYTAVATATGAQARDTQCATLSVSMTNGNIVYGTTGSASVASCWGR